MKKCLLWSSLLLSTSLAIAHEANRCELLSVTIHNTTSNACQLVSKSIKHGSLSSHASIPEQIPAGAITNSFEMKQNVFGVDIILSYDCGEGHLVSIESQQEPCLVEAGKVKGTVILASNMSAKSIVDHGSFIWDKAGGITWSFY